MMGLVGLAVLGIILGAAGMEFLRASKPEVAAKVENGVKHFANSVRPSKRCGKKAEEK